METRFGFKDFVICGLLLTVIGLVALSMLMFDRQWDHVQQIRREVEQVRDGQTELGKTMAARLDALAKSGIRTAPPTATEGPDAPRPPAAEFDPFYPVRRAQAAKDYATGDAFVGGLPVRVAKLTPIVPSDLYTQIIYGFALETLLQRNEDDLAQEPYIAKAWEVAKDGKSIRFDLRHDVKFSDGSPLTSADVRYSVELILNPDINCPDLRSYYDKVVAIETPDEWTVVFRLSEPYFLALSTLGSTPILSKKWYSRFTPAEFNEKPGLMFGSGPYMLDGDPETWKPMSGKIPLVRNPNYWGPRPALDRLTFIEYANDQARQNDFRAGVLDTYGVVPDQYLALKDDPQLLARADLRRFQSADDGYSYIGWNTTRSGRPTPFAAREVRQAMTMLVDRERIRREINNGLGSVATGPFAPDSPQADGGIKPWPYDPARAKAMLAAAGWQDRDGDGLLEDAKGRPFRFEFLYSAGHKGTDRMMLMVQDGLRRAGIQMDLNPLDWPVFLQRVKSKDFDACTVAWGGSIEHDPRQIFHTAAIADGGDNATSYSNQAFDALVDKARVCMDEKERNAMWKECHRILHEDQPYTFMFNRESVVFVDKRFRNVKDPKVGVYNYPSWYVPAGQQRRRQN